MKKILLFIILFILIIPATPSSAAISPTVRCPLPPKSQGKVNRIFFSFYKKQANLYSYIPHNLVLLDPIYTEDRPRCLTEQAYNSFIQMQEALFKDTGKRLIVLSAWRSRKTQEYFARVRSDFAASPGRSEHQLGVAVDLAISGSQEGELFGDSDVYQWMKIHAAEYGFVQSFTIEDNPTTGIPAEPWHWRFVGKNIATKITTEKLNLSKYLYDRAEAKKKGIIY